MHNRSITKVIEYVEAMIAIMKKTVSEIASNTRYEVGNVDIDSTHSKKFGKDGMKIHALWISKWNV
jgi:hypothetical protein